MKTIKLKLLKKAIKDAKRRGILDMEIIGNSGKRIKVREITVSNITGMSIRIVK